MTDNRTQQEKLHDRVKPNPNDAKTTGPNKPGEPKRK